MERIQSLTDRQTDRVVYFDWLRIMATFAVVVIHCCSLDSLTQGTYEWNIINTYNSLVQWAVPMFVMISGALFLGKDITLKILFRKYILRIASAFLFWSVLYALWRYFITHEKHSIKELILAIVKGNYHMWFLFLIVGLYLIVPFLSKIVKDQTLAIYFVILAFLFSFFFPQITEIVGIKFSGIAQVFNEFISKFRLEFVLGYSGYFVLGYLLNSVSISKKLEWVIYSLGICGAAVTVVSTVWVEKLQLFSNAFHDELTVNILFFTAAIFVFAKQHMNESIKSETSLRRLSFLSKCTFGAYLVHPMLIDCLKRFAGITNISFNPLAAVPLLAIAVFLGSMCISAVINKIPVVNKWIV